MTTVAVLSRRCFRGCLIVDAVSDACARSEDLKDIQGIMTKNIQDVLGRGEKVGLAQGPHTHTQQSRGEQGGGGGGGVGDDTRWQGGLVKLTLASRL